MKPKTKVENKIVEKRIIEYFMFIRKAMDRAFAEYKDGKKHGKIMESLYYSGKATSLISYLDRTMIRNEIIPDLPTPEEYFNTQPPLEEEF